MHKPAINSLDAVIGSYAPLLVQLVARAVPDDRFLIEEAKSMQENGYSLGGCRHFGSMTHSI